jgi:hypothetical protein
MFFINILQKYRIHLALKTQKPHESEVFIEIYIIYAKKYQNSFGKKAGTFFM